MGGPSLPQERRLVTAIPGPRSDELMARRRAVVPAGVWEVGDPFVIRQTVMTVPRDQHVGDRTGMVRLARILSNIISPPIMFALLGLALGVHAVSYTHLTLPTSDLV